MSGEIVAGSRVRFRTGTDKDVGVVLDVETSRDGAPHDIVVVKWPGRSCTKWPRALHELAGDDVVADEPTPFDTFINLAPQDMSDADMWRFLPDMLDALADRWGMPLEGQAAQSWGILTGLFRMTPDGVVAAVMATLARRGV